MDEDYRFVVGEKLRQDYENGRSYYALKGHRIVLPPEPGLRPDPEILEWHREQASLG